MSVFVVIIVALGRESKGTSGSQTACHVGGGASTAKASRIKGTH